MDYSTLIERVCHEVTDIALQLSKLDQSLAAQGTFGGEIVSLQMVDHIRQQAHGLSSFLTSMIAMNAGKGGEIDLSAATAQIELAAQRERLMGHRVANTTLRTEIW